LGPVTEYMCSNIIIAEIMIWNVLYSMVDGFHVLEQLGVSFSGQNMEAAGSFITQIYNHQTTFHNTAIIIYTVSHHHSLCNCNIYSTFLTGDET